MKKTSKIEYLPLLVLALGAAAAAVRGLMYQTAVDAKGLLTRDDPLQWVLLILCVLAVAAVLPVARQKGSNRYSDNFRSGIVPALGSIVMAAGVIATLLAGNPMPRPLLVLLWYASGVLAAAALVWAAFSLKKGSVPFVLCYGVLCLFFALQMISRYQPWSGNPQSQDWVFSLLGAVGLTLCAYHRSAFCADKGNRRIFLATALLTVFACCTALPHTEYFALYLCGGIWAFTGLCRVAAVPEPEAAPETE